MPIINCCKLRSARVSDFFPHAMAAANDNIVESTLNRVQDVQTTLNHRLTLTAINKQTSPVKSFKVN